MTRHTAWRRKTSEQPPHADDPTGRLCGRRKLRRLDVALDRRTAEQRGRRCLERVLQDRQRRDAGAAADQDRAPGGRRRGEALPERRERPHALAHRQPAQAPCSRTHVLEQEMRLTACATRDREGARQVRALVLAAPPALSRREHRELPRRGLCAAGVGQTQ